FTYTVTTEIYTLSLPTLFRSETSPSVHFTCHDKGRNLTAAGGDVGEAGRAESREKSGERAAKEVRREVDQHVAHFDAAVGAHREDRKSTRLNSSHQIISYAVF